MGCPNRDPAGCAGGGGVGMGVIQLLEYVIPPAPAPARHRKVQG